MRCSQCQFENRDTAKFCEECGIRLIRACPGCGQEVSPRAKFCSECGTPLTEQTPASGSAIPPVIGSQKPGAKATPAPGNAAPPTRGRAKTRESRTARHRPPSAWHEGPEAERRQLTVLFCDLVDSTALASRLDPEEWREVVRAYQATCAEVILRYEGHIAQYLGDGLLVYFGFPHAHEDDAQRAVQAGMSILEAMQTLNTQLERDKGLRLAVRVGIHTGLVVVGEMGGRGRHEQLALGNTPNVAARIQGLAAPDTVLISAATHQLVQGYVTVAALGPQPLKGVAAPVPVYRILDASAAQSRLDMAAATGLTPLVGRESEVALLLERWEQSKAGLGQVVLLSGEGGIGKSRLVEVLRQRVLSEDSPRLAFRCSPYHTNSALYSVIEHLQRVLQFERDDTPEEKLRKLEEVLARTGVQVPSPSRGQGQGGGEADAPVPPIPTFPRQGGREPLGEVVSLFAALLAVPLPEGRYPPLLLTPQQQRQRTLDALVVWLLAEAERQPVLAVWEDLHWADPSTLELLGLVIEQAPTARMLTLLTARPEFRPPWAPRSHRTQLTLGRLPRLQVETMVRQLTGDKPLPAEVLAQVVAKTDGVPLFVEELVKMILESGLVREEAERYVLTGPLPLLAIPATLHDSLMARLDRLATARAVAQLGAVLGREFAYELIAAVAPMDEATVQRGLAQLVDAELLYQRGRPPQARYLFKHALIQETAYQSLLKSTRQQFHRQIAQVLVERFAEIQETQPELLAHHYTEAGLVAQAIPYWQRAGQQALQRSANLEAVQHLTRGLALLATLPETPARAQQELDLQLALAPVLMAVKGFASPEVEQAYTRAMALCRQVGQSPQRFPALRGVWAFYHTRNQLNTARELAEQLLQLAQTLQHRGFLLEAHRAMGETLSRTGEWAAARAHFEAAMALYDPQQHRSHAFVYGNQDPEVYCLAHLSETLWLLGYPDQALQRSQQALTLAQELGHPFSLATALNFATPLYDFRREAPGTQERAEALRSLAQEQGFALRLAQVMFKLGLAAVAQGQVAEGLAQMRQGMTAYRATGAELGLPLMLGRLAEAQGIAGQPAEGLEVLAEALATAERTGERRSDAELYRLKGELRLAHAPEHQTEVEACFQQALAVARRQQAKSWELRAAISLARLWQQQGKRAEAYELLAPIYGWFTEGFDTLDLQEAKALLETLA